MFLPSLPFSTPPKKTKSCLILARPPIMNKARSGPKQKSRTCAVPKSLAQGTRLFFPSLVRAAAALGDRARHLPYLSSPRGRWLFLCEGRVPRSAALLLCFSVRPNSLPPRRHSPLPTLLCSKKARTYQKPCNQNAAREPLLRPRLARRAAACAGGWGCARGFGGSTFPRCCFPSFTA